MASTRPRNASVALRPAVRLLERSSELCDLGAVDRGHLWMQQRGRLVGGGELGPQLPHARAAFEFISSRHFRRRNAVHHHLDQLLAPVSMRSISRSAAEKLARCCIRSRFISRVNSSQNSSKSS